MGSKLSTIGTMKIKEREYSDKSKKGVKSRNFRKQMPHFWRVPKNNSRGSSVRKAILKPQKCKQEKMIKSIPWSYFKERKKKKKKIWNNILIIKPHQENLTHKTGENCNLLFQNKLKNTTKMTQDVKNNINQISKNSDLRLTELRKTSAMGGGGLQKWRLSLNELERKHIQHISDEHLSKWRVREKEQLMKQ